MIFWIILALAICAIYLGGAAGTYRFYMHDVAPTTPAYFRTREEKNAMLSAFLWPLFWLIYGFLFLAAGLQRSIRYLSGVK